MATTSSSQLTADQGPTGPAGGASPVSAWAPLRNPVFRSIWLAIVASNVGTWMHDVGTAWLMTSLTPSPLLVSLLQTATTLPVFLLALPAGALADVVDRRRMLMMLEAWMCLCAFTLAALTLMGLVTPVVLLVMTFALGMGAAMDAPAWQATTPEVVPKPELPAAVALSSVAINIARAVGPALGGFAIAAAGSAAPFLLNGVSFLGAVYVLYRWKRAPRESALPAEHVTGAVRAGIRYVRNSPPLRAALVRTGLFILCGSGFWALLPVRGRLELGLGSAGYGLLVGSIGVGALTGAVLLPKLRPKLSSDLLVAGATILFAAVAVALAYVPSYPLLCAVMLGGGFAWITLMSSFNVAAQMSVPAWVKARAMAVYLITLQGGTAVGAILWGALATRYGVRTALTLAAGGMILSLAAMVRYRLTAAEGIDLAPSAHWPLPVVTDEPDAERGPVMVTVEYRIDPVMATDFREAMREVSMERRRHGAVYWHVYVDAEDPARYIEVFIVASWLEHLRQHERVTVADRDVEVIARAFHVGAAPPLISHFVSGLEGRRSPAQGPGGTV
jgi:MFS family permease